LRAVSEAIRANLREMDVAARYGGEEFVVLLPETDLEGAHMVAERIRSALAAEPVIRLEDATGAWCSVSAGIATFPEHASNAARLVETADLALYSAKRSGKNRVVSAGSAAMGA
jgi:diguanylate cyclase (GGDEF)-like protein